MTDTWLSKESVLSIVIPNISIELFTGKQKLCSVFPRIRAWCFFSLTIMPLFLYYWFATLRGCPRKNVKGKFRSCTDYPKFFRESQQFYPMYKYHICFDQFYFFYFYETILKVTQKLLNSSSVTPIINGIPVVAQS